MEGGDLLVTDGFEDGFESCEEGGRREEEKEEEEEGGVS